MIRSFLFAPGNVPKLVPKVASFGADAIVLDLEDAVPLAEKKAARNMVRMALSQIEGPLRYVRVNGASTGLLEDDLSEIFCSDLEGVMIPKVETAEELIHVDSIISRLEYKHRITEGKIEIKPILETAKGVLRSYEILERSPKRVRRAGLGGGDLMREIGTRFGQKMLETDGLELQYARSHIVLASKAAGREPPIDTVYINIQDLKGLEQEAQLARRLGFQGKVAIYPTQVEVINRVFTPSVEEISYARKVITAFEEAEAKGSAAFIVNGSFADIAFVEKARSIIKEFESLKKS